MEVKKHPKVDLENYRVLFFLVGLVISLAVIFALFQWKNYNTNVEDLAVNDDAQFEQEDIPVTTREIKMPPPPPQKRILSNSIQIVKNDAQIEEQFNFNVETSDDEVINYDYDFDTEEGIENDTVFVAAEVMPVFPGGTRGLRKYIAEHIRYPVQAQENELEGTVIVQFVVDESGKVTNVKVLRGAYPVLDSEAVRVVRTLPRFKPGMNNGQRVKVLFTLPIVFKLQK